MLHRAEQRAPLLSSSRGKQPLSLDFADLHFLRSHSLHPGAVGDVILRARYYAFCVSKYLDSTDLFLRRRRRRRSSRFFSSQPLLGRPSALVFSSFARTIPLSLSHCSHRCRPSLSTLALGRSLGFSSSVLAQPTPHYWLLPLPFYCFALANLEPRWRRLTEFLIRNILPEGAPAYQLPPMLNTLQRTTDGEYPVLVSIYKL